MPSEPFLLVSLDEEKAKKLAQVIANDTCTKILNHLAQGKDGTETEIAKALDLPLSTVHYNLKQLVESKLVLSDEYHYSSKGREVAHYKLANKYIIIAPQEERESFLQKLRGVLPALVVTVGVAAVVKLVTDAWARGASSKIAAEATIMAFDASADVAFEPAPAGSALMAKAAPVAYAMEQAAPAPFVSSEAFLFFLAGAVFFAVLLAASAYVQRRK